MVGCGPAPTGINAASVRVTEWFIEVRIPLDEKTWGGSITLDETAGRQLAMQLKSNDPKISPSELPYTPGAFGVVFPYDVQWLSYANGSDPKYLDYVIWRKEDLNAAGPGLLPCYMSPEDLELRPPQSPRAKALNEMIQRARVNCANGVRVSFSTDQETILIQENWLLEGIAEYKPTHLEVYINTREFGLVKARIPFIWDFESEGKPSLTPPTDLRSKIQLAPSFHN